MLALDWNRPVGSAFVTIRSTLLLAALASLSAACSSGGGEGSSFASPSAVSESLASEAGFVTLPPQPAGASYSARMFYSFRPADEALTSKPLFVLFNGGPGYATTSGLAAYGTGPSTLVDGTPTDAPPQPNAASYTRFANLLYIDERATGLSYPLRAADGGAPRFDCSFSPEGDAGDYAILLLSFLEAHPALRDAPIFVMGESYGGMRAVSLMRILLHSDDPELHIDESLRAAVARHFGAADGGAAPSHDQVTRQFKGLVLLEPWVAGPEQFEAELPLLEHDPYLGPRLTDDKYDPYDMQKPAGWAATLGARANHALSDPDGSRSLFGVDLATVPELLPAARHDAFRPTPVTADGICSAKDDQAASERIAARLGALGPNDYYLGTMVHSCREDGLFADKRLFGWFLDDLANVKVFVTHARWDAVIYSPAIPEAIKKGGFPTTVDTQPREGYARPGWIEVALPARDGQPAQSIEIRFPNYDESGHMVATNQGPDLAADIVQWMQGL